MAMLVKSTHNAGLQYILKGFSSFYLNSGLRNFSTEVAVPDQLTEDSEEQELENKKRERFIERKRNVSRLNPEHRNIVHNRPPYPEPKADLHITVKYRRKMYGKYGSDSGVNPGIMWPTKEEIKERKEYEDFAYSTTIQEMVRTELSRKEAEEAALWDRQKQISENMKKLDKWVDDLESRRAKKIKVTAEAKAKNDRLVEEVRRHFGYTVDHREERFQKMLEQKLKEEKKIAKIEKKKKREEMLLQDLMSAAQKEGNK